MRTSLLFVTLACVLACGAWHSHAETEAAVSPRFPPAPAPTSPRKVDEYGNISWNDEKARLNNYITELRNDPTIRACIICYGGRRSRAGEARGRCARAAEYVKRARGIDAARVVTLDGGYREELTVELWTPPAGSVLPPAAPTVDPSEVTFIRGRPGRKRPRRWAERRPAGRP